MFNILKTRILQGHFTSRYPRVKPSLPDRFKGLPVFDSTRCNSGCSVCTVSCPVGAFDRIHGEPLLDLGKCTFCGNCATLCAKKAITFTNNHCLSARKREDLFLHADSIPKKFEPLEPARLSLLSSSIKLRQVSAGGCNACESDVNVLNTLVFDLARFGIQFVASPRHADGLLVTGPVTKNMESALAKTWDATPSPKVVIAVGACAISGGMFSKHSAVHRGVNELLPVDLYIPGCPPHPYTILDGLLKLLGKI